MKVYILTNSYHYESTEIISVHANEKSAVISMYKEAGIPADKKMALATKDERHITLGLRIIAIDEWEVDEA